MPESMLFVNSIADFSAFDTIFTASKPSANTLKARAKIDLSVRLKKDALRMRFGAVFDEPKSLQIPIASAESD